MALKKSKKTIFDKIDKKKINEEISDWLEDVDYYDIDLYVNYDYYYWGYDYDYLTKHSKTYIQRVKKLPSIVTLPEGKLIDMKSVYGKELSRQKKINALLGLEYEENYKTKLSDILKVKN